MQHHTHKLKLSGKPKLLALGTRDDFTSEESLRAFAAECRAPPGCVLHMYPGADHFAFVSPPCSGRLAHHVMAFLRNTMVAV